MATEAFTDFVVGHGELWCAQLLAATCKQMGADVAFMDTRYARLLCRHLVFYTVTFRDILVVTPTADGNAVDVQYDVTNKKLDLWGQANGTPRVCHNLVDCLVAQRIVIACPSARLLTDFAHTNTIVSCCTRQVVVATGFIARNPAGQATTLKRNGSDYSATIMGALFQCRNITIWTDVDGVYRYSP